MAKIILNIFLILLLITVAFVGYLYYLGATDPTFELEEEILVDDNWRTYREHTTDDPGEITVFNERSYVSPFTLRGEAHSSWFAGSNADALVIAPDETVLWEGPATANENHVFDMVVPFSAEVDVGDYAGAATFILYQGSESEELTNEYSYTVNIVIEPDIIDEID